jgi:hypothetical protein
MKNGVGGQRGTIKQRTYMKDDKSLGPVDGIPLEVLGSSLQYFLIDTSDHLPDTAHQLVR